MPDFKGSNLVRLQPETSGYPLRVSFQAASAADENDGSIPYGTSISSAVVKAYDPAGTEATDLVDSGSVSVDGDDVTCTLSYPTTSLASYLDTLSSDDQDEVRLVTYTLEYRLTLNTGAVLVYDARRVVVGDSSA